MTMKTKQPMNIKFFIPSLLKFLFINILFITNNGIIIDSLYCVPINNI